jgi:hypothetical protein
VTRTLHLSAAVVLGTLIALSTVSACGSAENSPGADRAAAAADVHVVGWPWVDPGADRAAAAAPSRVVAEHGSITAIDHRDQLTFSGDTATRTVAEHGSITAIDHRDQLAVSGDDS